MELEIEAFRAGKFTSMEGSEDEYTPEQVEAIAQAYDPNLSPSPVVIGHPRHDSPAYGWIKSARRQGEKLLLGLEHLSKDFVTMLKNKNYRKVSVSMFPPTHPANPKPGEYYIKHIGFLGAAPPAVTGLKTVDLSSEKPTPTYEFELEEKPIAYYTILTTEDEPKPNKGINIEETSPNPTMNLLKEFRSFTGLSIERLAELSSFTTEEITAMEKGDREITDEDRAKLKQAFESSTQSPDSEPTSESTPEPVAETPDNTQEFAALRTEFELQKRRLDGVEKALTQERQQLQKERAELERDRVSSFCDSLVRNFKIKPDQKSETIELILATPNEKTASFTAADSPRALLMQRLEASPSLVDRTEIDLTDDYTAVSTDALDFVAPPGASVDPESMKIYRKAKEYQANHQELSFSECVMRVQGN